MTARSRAPGSASPGSVIAVAIVLALGVACRGPGSHAGSAGSSSHVETGAGSGVEASGLRVLFIGNSYTYVNDLPGMLARIALTSGEPPSITVEEVVRGGARLVDHWDTGTAQERIRERPWTHVVLQGQSLEMIDGLDPENPRGQFAEYAGRFGELVVERGARPTWYATWARAPGDGVYKGGRTPATLQDGITAAYVAAARRWPQSLVVCVGEAFRRSLRERPAIALHSSDRSHPSIAGTYLAAATFYVALTGRPVPAASAVPDGLAASDAAALREIARIGSSCARDRAPARTAAP